MPSVPKYDLHDIEVELDDPLDLRQAPGDRDGPVPRRLEVSPRLHPPDVDLKHPAGFLHRFGTKCDYQKTSEFVRRHSIYICKLKYS